MKQPSPARSESEATEPRRQAERDAAGRKRLIRGIMAGVVIWGAFLATGMWLSTRNWQGPAFIMACVFTFLGFWAWMLARRAADQDSSRE